MPEKLLTRRNIQAAVDLPTEDIHVPEWGGTIRLQGLTGKAVQDYTDGTVEIDPKSGKILAMKLKDAKVKLLALTVVDEDGIPLYDANKQEDLDELNRKSASVIDILYEHAAELSGLPMGKTEDDEAGND